MKTMVDEKTAEITRLQQLLKEQREILMREQRLISTAFYEFGTKIIFLFIFIVCLCCSSFEFSYIILTISLIFF